MNQNRIDVFAEHLELTKTEKKVLECMLKYKTLKETAEELNMKMKTVEYHRTNIYKKIGGKGNLDLFL